jgi:hypothetical protein
MAWWDAGGDISLAWTPIQFPPDVKIGKSTPRLLLAIFGTPELIVPVVILLLQVVTSPLVPSMIYAYAQIYVKDCTLVDI